MYAVCDIWHIPCYNMIFSDLFYLKAEQRIRLYGSACDSLEGGFLVVVLISENDYRVLRSVG